jgi:hypothetical protein
MAHKSPLAAVKEVFGDKAKLVEAVEKLTGDELWVARTNKSKGLAHVSNAKLLRLHATFTAVKEKFGTREKLVDAILELENRAKDAGMRQRLAEWPVPRLFDVYKSTAKRNARAAAADKAPAAKAADAKAPAAKAPAKKAAPAKAAPAKAAPAAKKAAKAKAEKPGKPAKK